MKGCKFEDCGRKLKGLGYCTGHFAQVQRGQEPRPLLRHHWNAARDDMGRKLCRGFCERWMPETEFGLDSDAVDRLQRFCRSCINAENGGRRYSMTPEEFLERTSRPCAICGDKSQAKHLDHNHACCEGAKSCGKCLRDTLCAQCNVGLGSYRDNPELLRKAAEYLDIWSEDR